MIDPQNLKEGVSQALTAYLKARGVANPQATVDAKLAQATGIVIAEFMAVRQGTDDDRDLEKAKSAAFKKLKDWSKTI